MNQLRTTSFPSLFSILRLQSPSCRRGLCSTILKDDQDDPDDPKGSPDTSSTGETVIQRLIRLSNSSPQEFGARSPEELASAKARYRSVLEDYRSNFSRTEFLRQRNPNYRSPRQGNNYNYSNNRGGGFGGGGWRNNNDWNDGGDDQQRRYFSTSSRVVQEESSIIERLKRLSVTTGEDPFTREGQGGPGQPRERKSWEGFGGGGQSQYPGHRQGQYKGQGGHSNDRGSGGRWSDEGSMSGYRKQSQSQSSNIRKWDDYGRQGQRNRGDYFQDGGGGGRDRRRDSEPPGYERVIRRDTEDAERVRKFGRNMDDSHETWAEFREKRRKSYEKPSSTAVMGDYSAIAAKEKNRNKSPTGTMNRDPDQNRKIAVAAAAATVASRSSPPSEDDADLDLSTILSQSDGDTFGTLSIGPVPVKDYVGASLKRELLQESASLGLGDLDEPEEDDTKFLPDREEKWTMLRLVKKVKLLVDEMKVKEAVDTVNSALAAGGFQYSTQKFQYIYNLLISSCAAVGYVKMAFKLFREMKDRGFPPRHSTYTSLFNVCSNSTWDAEANIKRMNGLRESMMEKGFPPNQIVYHAMIKGYGRNGDIESAFGVVDEMISSGGFPPNTETFNMLLQACISNTENGFRHVLVTWRKMAQMNISPDIYTFNLLLRGVRECGIVPEPQLMSGGSDLGENFANNSHSSSEALLLLPPITSEEESNDMLNLLCLNEPDALTRINDRMTAESSSTSGRPYSYMDLIEALKQPQNRLTVFGGLRGFMTEMTTNRVGPNLKTVTELGQVIHSSEIGDLIMMMKTYKLNPDITFFNLMMKRYYDTQNPVGARKLVACLPQFGLSPNIMTWGVSATGCTSKVMAKQLMEEMDAANFTPNIQIMGGLLNQATKSFDPSYVYWVMEEINHREIRADPKFLLTIEEFKGVVKKGIISKEMGKPIQPTKLSQILSDEVSSAHFAEGMTMFRHRYNSWMAKAQVSLEARDPWEEDFRNFKKNRTHGTLPTDQTDPDNSDSDQIITNAAKS